MQPRFVRWIVYLLVLVLLLSTLASAITLFL